MNIIKLTMASVIAIPVAKHVTPPVLLKGTCMCIVKINCMSVASAVNHLHLRVNGSNIDSNIAELQPSPVTNVSNGSCTRVN